MLSNYNLNLVLKKTRSVRLTVKAKIAYQAEEKNQVQQFHVSFVSLLEEKQHISCILLCISIISSSVCSVY